MNRQQIIERIRQEKAEAQKAGKYHKRDLYKHIKRMERELRDYDRFKRESVALLDARGSTLIG